MLDSEKSEIGAVNLKTGELVSGAVVITPAMREEIKRKKEKEKRINYLYKEYGHFYWFFYKMQEKLFDGCIDEATISRVIYLATYLSYHDNKLVFDNRKLIHENNLQKILKLPDGTYRSFLKKCKNNNLLTINEDDTISLSTQYFNRGRLDKKIILQKKEEECWTMKMYNDGIRYMYENSDLCSHKNLAYLFVLIPYSSIEYNIICENPWETDMDKVVALSLKDICEIIKYNPKNQKRLFNSLLNIKIKDKPAMRFIVDSNGERVYINPSVYYNGKKHEEVKVLGKF